MKASKFARRHYESCLNVSGFLDKKHCWLVWCCVCEVWVKGVRHNITTRAPFLNKSIKHKAIGIANCTASNVVHEIHGLKKKKKKHIWTP